MKIVNKTLFLSFLPILAFSCNQKSNIHMILIAGQSNAIGWSPIDSAKADPDFDVYNVTNDNQMIIYQNYGKEIAPGLFSSNKSFENVQFGQGLWNNAFGPEIGIAKVLREKCPNEKYYFIKYAMNSSTVNEDWTLSNPFYKYFKSFIKENIDGLSKKYKVSVDGLMWMQGENDADGKSRNPEKYGENLKNIFNDIKTTFNENMIIVDAGISDCSEWVDYKLINDQKRELDKLVKNHYYFDTIEMGLTFFDSGQMHYDGPSMLKLGSMFGNTFLKNK